MVRAKALSVERLYWSGPRDSNSEAARSEHARFASFRQSRTWRMDRDLNPGGCYTLPFSRRTQSTGLCHPSAVGGSLPSLPPWTIYWCRPRESNSALPACRAGALDQKARAAWSEPKESNLPQPAYQAGPFYQYWQTPMFWYPVRESNSHLLDVSQPSCPLDEPGMWLRSGDSNPFASAYETAPDTMPAPRNVVMVALLGFEPRLNRV